MLERNLYSAVRTRQQDEVNQCIASGKASRLYLDEQGRFHTNCKQCT